LWAIAHILDEHCVDKIFSKPWVGVITSSGISVGIFWLFGYLINGNSCIGIVLLVFVSVGLCLIDKFSGKWNTPFLMSIAAALQTVVVLLEKYIFDRTVGVIMTGIWLIGANAEG
jgi:hypothetical protein